MGYKYSRASIYSPSSTPYTRRNPVKHPVFATLVAAGTLAAIVAAYQRGAQVYQELVDKGEIDPLVRLNPYKGETFDNRSITNLPLPVETVPALYRIPDYEPQIEIPTQRAAIGYYRGVGIFVYFPRGIRFGKKQTHDILTHIAKRFFEATDGEFHFDMPPKGNAGGSNIATGLITAGLTNFAYRDAPGMRATAQTLTQVIEELDHDDVEELMEAIRLSE